MPAITLGLAEVEDRLRALRRRLNAVTAQHSVYISLSVIIVVFTVLIILGLRGSAAAFRAATWGGVALCLAAGAWGVVTARMRWLDGVATARLADRRATLRDRLVTLVDLRARPRPSRLAPVLVAQLLALSKQWQPQQIAPRRIPRSVFALVGALLALGSTAFIERRPPAPPPPAQAGAGTTGALTAASPQARFMAGGSAGAQAGDGTVMPGVPPAGDLPQGQVAAGGAANGLPPPGELQRDAPPGTERLSEGAQAGIVPQGAKSGQGNDEHLKQPGGPLTSLPDRLQEAIRRAFHAESMDRPQALAARTDPSNHDPAARGDDQQGNQDRQRRDAADAGKSGAKTQAGQKGTGPGTQNGPGKPKSGDQVAQRQDGNPTNQNFNGNSPAAGEGSSPGGLMDGKAQSVASGAGTPKTFKLTITSFLHAMEQKGNQPRQPGKKTGSGGAASTGSATQVALNERQLNDDALRKAEIPPEYEDIVRRVYSLRADQ